MELMPGDVLLTYKKPPSWNLLQQFFDSRIEVKSIKKYGWGCNYPECNHVRPYIGKSFRGDWVFEYTFPASRFDLFKVWMLNPNYCRVFRLKEEYRKLFDIDKYWQLALGNTGSIYDFTQLIDMWIGWGRVFDLGKTMRVCSTGARYLLEQACGGINLFPDTKLHQTLPCAFANSPKFFEVETDFQGSGGLTLQPEPKCERCVAL